MTKTTSLRPRAKARVMQMASKLFCQLKALNKMAPLGATNSISSVTNSFNLCLLFIVFYRWELGYKPISEFA